MGFLDSVKGVFRDAVAPRSSRQAAAATRTDDVPSAADEAQVEAPVDVAVEETLRTCTVVVGDTLDEISAREGTSVEEIVRLNDDIADPDLIFPGQVLRLPAA